MAELKADEPGLDRLIRTLRETADRDDLTDDEKIEILIAVRDGIRELRITLEKLVDSRVGSVTDQARAARRAINALVKTKGLTE